MRGTLVVLIFLFSLHCAAQPQNGSTETLVYEANTGGYSHFRIPALIQVEDTLLAFAEGRKYSLHDNGQIDLVLKRSVDGGKSWQALIVAVQVEGASSQNPTPVYISEEKKILLLFTARTVSSDTESAIRAGTSEGSIAVYTTCSSDFGWSWSEPHEITAEVKPIHWNWYAVGPGGALVLKHHPEYAGRIVVPANHSSGNSTSNEALGAHVLYSDDKGKTWVVGAIDSTGAEGINPNETTVVELEDGRLYFNTRNQTSEAHVAHRGYSWSLDGGNTFEHTFKPETALRCPVVHASLAGVNNHIYFIGPDDPVLRKNLTVWKTDPTLESWTRVTQLHTGFSAYSSTITGDNSLGILYETDNYNKIVFKNVRPTHHE